MKFHGNQTTAEDVETSIGMLRNVRGVVLTAVFEPLITRGMDFASGRILGISINFASGP